MFRIEWDSGRSYYFDAEHVSGCLKQGVWKLVEMPLGEFFKFETKQGTCVCTYTKQASGNPIISWANTSTTRYSEKDCRANIESGEWSVLPSEPAQTAEQSSENAFKALEDVVRNRKQLNMQNGSTLVFSTGSAVTSTCEDSVWESSNNMLDSIKAFTQSGKFSVGIHRGIYTVYGRDDEYKATSDKQLVEVMKALEILEGCV